jgi:hypothetical protein
VENREVQRQRVDRLDHWIRVFGALGLVIAVCGVVVFFDTRYQRNMARDFLARGVPSVATEIELRVKSGRGGTYVDEVEVVFPTETGPRQRATLNANLGDPEGAEPGHRQPSPGSRYASPLALLYLPQDKQVIAAVDATTSPTTRQHRTLPSA